MTNSKKEEIKKEYLGKFSPNTYVLGTGQDNVEWWLSKFDKLIQEKAEKIEKAYDFPCRCYVKQKECKHNYDHMHLAITILKE